MHKVVPPFRFPQVDNLESVYRQENILKAIQVESEAEEICHPCLLALPFRWHNEQVKILYGQPEGGRRFGCTHRERQKYVSYLKNAKRFVGAIVDTDLDINKDTLYHSWGKSVNFNPLLFNKITKISDPVFYLGETLEYFHWIMDCLTGLYLWEKLDLSHFSYLYVANATDFKMETLAAYGVPTEKIISDKLDHASFEHIFVPSTLGGGQAWGAPRYLPEFHRKSVVNIPPAEGAYDKIYVSRSKTKRRPMNNERKVEDLLAKKGFKVLFFEDYTFEEQIRFMKSARVVIAPHGAGLTNIVYCAPSTIIVELLCEYYLNCCFYKLSVVSKHRYIPLVNDSYNVTGNTLHDHNWDVDIAKLDEIVDYILNDI